MLQTRNMENRPKSTKTWNCKHCWMKVHKHKNNSQSNWALVNKLFPIERWKRFRKSTGCYMNWRRDRWRGTKTHVKFCLNDTEESHSCIVSLLGMKSGFFLRIPSAKNHGQTIDIDRKNRFGRKTMLCVWCDQKDVVYYELLKSGEICLVNINNWSIWIVRCLKKWPKYQKRQHKVIFLHDNAPSHTAKPVRDVGSTQLESFTPCGLVIRLGSFRLSLVCIDESRTCWAALWFVDVKKWLDEWFAAKGEDFYWRIHKLPERWEKCVTSNGAYFE